MSDLNEQDKRKLRQSEEYRKTKAILDFHFAAVTKLRAKVGPTPPAEYVFGTRYEWFKRNCADFAERWEEAKKVSGILRDLKNLVAFENLPPKFKSMNKMLIYLGLVESLGIALADIVLVLLIANEREVHTGGRSPKHVTKIKELEDISLADKLDFLNREEVGIFSGFINKKTRNKIAHLDFTIDEDGKITTKGNSQQKQIDIDARMKDFWKGVHTLEVIFEDIEFTRWFEGGSSRSEKRE